MKSVYVTGGVLLSGVVLIGALLSLDFFDLFRPPELTRWEEDVPPTFIEPEGGAFGFENLEDLADVVDERLAALLKEGPPAYTPEQAEGWADELIPALERICQRDFARRPTIKLAERTELAETIARWLYAQYEAAAPGLAGPFLERRVEAMAAFQSAMYLGMYDPVDKVLYLAPTNVRAIMACENIDARHFEPFVKLVIAHELAHALQDQVVGFTSLPPYAYTPDGSAAHRSVIEGHAVFVADLVGHELGMDETSLEASRMMSAGAVTVEDPVLDRLHRAAEVQYEEIYLGGRDFIAHHFKEGDMDRVWEILAAPPANTSMITDPATYATTWRPATSFFRVLKGIEKQFGPGWHYSRQVPLTALALHGQFAVLDNETRDRLVAGIEHARMVELIEWPGEDTASIYVTVLRGRENVDPYYAALRAIQDRITGWTVDDQVEGPPGIVADESRRHTHVPENGLEGETPYLHVHARRGLVIVDLNCTDPALGDEIIAGIIGTVLERLESISKDAGKGAAE